MAPATLTHQTAGSAVDLPQHLAALLRANEARSDRARFKRDVKAGRITWEQALTHQCAAKMELLDLLVCLPRVGRQVAFRRVQASGVNPCKLVGSFTERQRRDELAGLA